MHQYKIASIEIHPLEEGLNEQELLSGLMKRYGMWQLFKGYNAYDLDKQPSVIVTDLGTTIRVQVFNTCDERDPTVYEGEAEREDGSFTVIQDNWIHVLHTA